MDRPMINETLFNTEYYSDLREQMVLELTAGELDQPEHILRVLLEDFIMHMIDNMEDEDLQDLYDNMKVAKNKEKFS
jgi:hypothetical protein